MMNDSERLQVKEVVREVLREYDANKPRLTTDDVTDAVRAGVVDAFGKAGMDLSTKDAQMSVQRDHHFLRKLRHHFEAMGKFTTRAIIGLLVIAVIAFLALFHKG